MGSCSRTLLISARWDSWYSRRRREGFRILVDRRTLLSVTAVGSVISCSVCCVSMISLLSSPPSGSMLPGMVASSGVSKTSSLACVPFWFRCFVGRGSYHGRFSPFRCSAPGSARGSDLLGRAELALILPVGARPFLVVLPAYGREFRVVLDMELWGGESRGER